MVKLATRSSIPMLLFPNVSQAANAARQIWKRHALDIIGGIIVFAVGVLIAMPKATLVDQEYLATLPDPKTTQLLIEQMQNQTLAFGQLPIADVHEPRQVVRIPITAYTSQIPLTDSSPCITASGMDVCAHGIENIVAANFLPIGTRVRIPELFGDRVFYVQDKMNARYYYKMDIWMKDYEQAKKFGVQYATVEIF